MEEKVEQVLRLLAMDIREYMSQEKWIEQAKRMLYPIIFNNESNLVETLVMQKIAEDIGGWKEDMKAVIADAIDRQETQMNEDYERGREEATKYALEMFDKHVSNFSA